MTPMTNDQIDALQEVVNVGVGHAAGTLQKILKLNIELEVPQISVYSFEDFMEHMKEDDLNELSCVYLMFYGKFNGLASLVFPPESAVKLVTVITGESSADLSVDGLMAETLNEIGNIVINNVIGMMCNILEVELDFSLPLYVEGDLADVMKTLTSLGKIVMVLKTIFKIGEKEIEGHVFVILSIDTVDTLLTLIDNLYDE